MRTHLLAIALLLAGASAAHAAPKASPKPEAKVFRFQQVRTAKLAAADRKAFEGAEVWGAPCHFEAEALHDTLVFAVLVRIADGERSTFLGGVDTAIGPLDLSALRSGGRPVVDPTRDPLTCIRKPGSTRYGAVVLAYRIEDREPTRHALLRVSLDGKKAPEATLVGHYATSKAAIEAAASVIPENDNRLPAGWKSFLEESGQEFCLQAECPR